MSGRRKETELCREASDRFLFSFVIGENAVQTRNLENVAHGAARIHDGQFSPAALEKLRTYDDRAEPGAVHKCQPIEVQEHMCVTLLRDLAENVAHLRVPAAGRKASGNIENDHRAALPPLNVQNGFLLNSLLQVACQFEVIVWFGFATANKSDGEQV